MKKSSCEKYYDRVAHTYDDSYKTPYWEFYNAVTWHNMKRYLPTDLSTHILDIGGGTGLWALKLAKSGYKVVLSDISRKMLDVARTKAEKTNLSGKIEFIRADICDLSLFEEGNFGFVIAMGDTLSYCSSPQKAVKEIYRALKPQGIFIASVDNKFAAIRFFLEDGKIDELESAIQTGRVHWFTAKKEEQYPIISFSPDELTKLFEQNGFEVLSLIGKMVLPIGRKDEQLKEKETFDRLFRLELRLHSTPYLLGSAGHLQIVGRKR